MRLRNNKHENFAQGVADGLTASRSYRENVSRKPQGNSLHCCASILLSDPKVAQRIEELRKMAGDILEKRLGVRKETLLRFHVDIINDPKEKTWTRQASASALADLAGWTKEREATGSDVVRAIVEAAASAQSNKNEP